MVDAPLPDCVVRLLWDVDASQVDRERDAALILERVMSRGTWEAMKWLRATYPKPSPRSSGNRGRDDSRRAILAYWALVCDVDVAVKTGGGRPSWAG